MANPILIYVPTRTPSGLTVGAETVVALAKDNWDDYTYKTTFEVYLIRGEEQSKIGAIRLLLENEKETSAVLNAARDAPTGGKVLDFGGRRYLSLGTGVDYYSELMRLLPDQIDREHVLSALHDTIYLEQRQPESLDLLLRETDGFRLSLLRGTSETKTYGGARQVLFPEEARPGRFNFTLRFLLSRFSAPHEFQFRFDPDAEQAVPTNMVVLIGKNGLGKTQALYHAVDYLLAEGRGHPDSVKQLNFTPIEPVPPFKHIIAVSFSPFEEFPLKAAPGTAVPPSGFLNEVRVTTSSRYTYCGFREISDVSGNLSVRQYRVAWRRTHQSLIEILQHDEEELQNRSGSGRPKFASLLRVLRDGLEFDTILVELPAVTPVPKSIADAIDTIGDVRYIDVRLAESRNRADLLQLLRSFAPEKALRFKRDDDKVVRQFSAGQAMFLFMAFSVIAGVQRDSLLFIDEPEIYLHPNLEVAYLRMLMTLLQVFESYAIIATHSVFVARETPARNLRIVSEGDGFRPLVNPPSIETFGADISEIANMAFDNISADKPFQLWLKTLVKNETDYQNIRSRFGKYLNAKSLTFLRNEIAQQNEAAEQPTVDEKQPLNDQAPGANEEA